MAANNVSEPTKPPQESNGDNESPEVGGKRLTRPWEASPSGITPPAHRFKGDTLSSDDFLEFLKDPRVVQAFQLIMQPVFEQSVSQKMESVVERLEKLETEVGDLKSTSPEQGIESSVVQTKCNQLQARCDQLEAKICELQGQRCKGQKNP